VYTARWIRRQAEADHDDDAAHVKLDRWQHDNQLLIRLRYRIVDVFSARPLVGNALCGVLDPCPAPVMSAIAREVNLSETTFPTVTDDAAYDVRIFTPGVELPFAGHPSLGTAWVLGPRQWTQTSPGAVVTIDADDDGAVMSQPDPIFTDVDPAPLANAAGLPRAEAAVTAEVGGLVHSIVATDAPIERLAPSVAAVIQAAARVGAASIAVVCARDESTLHVRVFAPGAGVAEDPGTGSAAGPIGLFANKVFGTATDLTIFQGAEMGRPSQIDVHAELGAVRVGGRVTACAEGTFTL
jgi:trans-2,3-dihydro-3-hydroxyanthranilate isomerase